MWSSCATILFLTHFDAICDLLLNRRSATWNLPINFHEICYEGGMNEFCLTKDQTSPKSPPPPSFPGATPLVGGRCQPCVDRGSITQQKAPITLTARRKLVLVMFNWMQRIIEVFYSRIVYSTSR